MCCENDRDCAKILYHNMIKICSFLNRLWPPDRRARVLSLSFPGQPPRKCAEHQKGVSQQILTSLRGGENSQGWPGNHGLNIPRRFIMSWQGRFYEGSGVPLLSGSVEIRSLRGSIVTRAPVDKSSAAASSANKTACSAIAGRISSARIAWGSGGCGKQ
jgi:hypothetical protein